MTPYHFKLEAGGLHYDYKNQVADDLRRRARECDARQAGAKSTWKSVADFEAHRLQMRQNLLDAIGGLPSEKTPLQATVTGVLGEPGFSIEKLHFQSLPGYYVTANCYVPHGRSTPGPAVLFLCGHTAAGKASGYQKVCRDLVLSGFVVLIIDPIGQGERWQYMREGANIHPCNPAEHSYAGLPLLVQGASVARHFVWDAVRSIDYLLERGDVDAGKIGAVGNSGGGTQTALLALLEPRLAAAMPCTWITSLYHMMLTGWAQDMEQVAYGALLRGPDHDDFLTGIAPRPLMLGLAAYDPFPIEGSLQSFERARPAYQLYGQEGALQITIDQVPHGFSKGLRQACVNFFRKELAGLPGDFVAGDQRVLEAEQLQVTRAGQVVLEFPACRSITDLTSENLRGNSRSPHRSTAELRQALARVLALEECGSRQAPIYPRIRATQHAGHRVEELFFFSATEVAVAGVLFHPETPTPSETTILLLLEGGSTALQQDAALLEKLLAGGNRVFVFDPRGWGAVQARWESASEVLHPNDPTFPLQYPFFTTEFKLGCDALMLGLSLAGLRVFDTLRAFDYLQSRADTRHVEIYGVGKAAPLAFFAAVLEPRITAVTCQDMLASYATLCSTPFYDATRFNLDIMPWGLLREGDLQDFSPCIAPRRLTLISPRDAQDGILPDTVWDACAQYQKPSHPLP